MKKGLKYIQFVDVLPRVQRDFIIFKMSSAQFTNLRLINLLQSNFLRNIV